jgi:hypothetical protein
MGVNDYKVGDEIENYKIKYIITGFGESWVKPASSGLNDIIQEETLCYGYLKPKPKPKPTKGK